MKQKKIKKKPESDPAFMPGHPKKTREAMKQVFGMWADREDRKDVNEWRRKLWEMSFNGRDFFTSSL